MSRYTDIYPRGLALTNPSYLPIVDWSQVGGTPPTPVTFTYGGTNAKAPKADIIVMTWTSAEWAAMDHVFLRSSTAQSPSSNVSASQWFLYSRSAPSSSRDNPLWGYFQLVNIKGSNNNQHTVLLFKSGAHLAHPPWLNGLSNELKDLIADVGAKTFYSIGTAGAANLQQNLGDVVITNAAKFQLTNSENTGSGLNGKTFTCSSFFPNTTGLLTQVQQKLFYKLNEVATQSGLQNLLAESKGSKRNKSLLPYQLNDFMNSAIDPTNLGSPKAINMKGSPELTADSYFIAEGNTPYAAMDMDDAVIAEMMTGLNVPFAFIRNISDTVIPTMDHNNKPISDDARDAWSSALYEKYGIYTSYNSALATWAVIADS
jgi:nucleoside phosphorylase